MRPSSPHFILTLCGLLFVSPALLVARQDFTGLIESKNVTTDETGANVGFTMLIWIGEQNVKIQNTYDGTIPASTMIYRNDRHVLWMLNTDDKTFFEIRQDEKPETVTPPGRPGQEERFAVKRTGKKKKILGYDCEQVVLRRSDQETEIWGSRKLAYLSGVISKRLGGEQVEQGGGWSEEVEKLGLFPLAATTRIEGVVAESQEIIRIEPRMIPPEVFEIPAGYKKQSLGSIIDGETREK